MTRLRALVALLFLVAAAAPDARAGLAWSVGAGTNVPRYGPSTLGSYHRAGGSFVVNLTRDLGETSGGYVRLEYSAFPAQRLSLIEDAQYMADFPDPGTASMVALVSGTRFQAWEREFSPYFDVGIGIATASLRAFSRDFPVVASGRGSATSWLFDWGAGLAWRPHPHAGVFVDGHWDTVPGDGRSHAWVGAARAGVEWR